MRKLFYKKSIEDVQSIGLSPEEQEHLLDLFENAMATSATTLARTLSFNTSDFALAEKYGIAGFELQVKRGIARPEIEMWHGEFVKGDKTMSVLGALEKNEGVLPDRESA